MERNGGHLDLPVSTRLLVIEDSPSDAMLLECALRASVMAVSEVVCASSLGAGLERLKEGPFDAVLVDLGLPDSDGLDTFAFVSDAAGPAAIVVVTGREDERLAEAAVGLGAQDYLRKSEARPGELGRAVMHAIRRRRVQLELERARDEQLDAKDRFLSRVSHELRSPLAVVHQFGSLLQDGIGGSLTADQHDYLTVLMRNVRQLKVMIDDLLEVTRIQGGRLCIRPVALSLEAPLREVVAAYRLGGEARRVTVCAEVGVLPIVLADADRLHEVVGNLVENALKYTPDGGRITVGAVREGDYVRVTVRDTGHGIRPADLERIFGQFVQADQSEDISRNGLGLGLFVCRAIIEQMGGVMTAESTYGQGAAISFTLPVRTEDNDPGSSGPGGSALDDHEEPLLASASGPTNSRIDGGPIPLWSADLGSDTAP